MSLEAFIQGLSALCVPYCGKLSKFIKLHICLCVFFPHCVKIKSFEAGGIFREIDKIQSHSNSKSHDLHMKSE